MLPDTAYYFQALSVGERSLAKAENNQFLNYLRLCIFSLEIPSVPISSPSCDYRA
ncbi:hypothetical protein Aazo_1066 ['Nostoc azollae' 0708]|jgi:hypothetical protein|uniref:Uncharacterized protein n=1 Tax=Nostoc azollae (strain 0708) TaxID=551115 RepID=D7E2P6_NOSA0|nr:hypothetical protein Aazo_1066 ['Nostoc azollae' 0708]